MYLSTELLSLSRSLLDNYMSLKSGETSEGLDLAVFKRRLKHFVGIVEKRYPDAMDAIIEERMKKKPSKQEKAYNHCQNHANCKANYYPDDRVKINST